MTLPREYLDELRRRVDLATLIGRDTNLTPCGRRLRGLSPLVRETQPSFFVEPEEGRWASWAGGEFKFGDAIEYLKEKQGVSFLEAVHMLSADVGMQPPEMSDEEWHRTITAAEEQRKVQRWLTEAAGYFHATFARYPEIKEELLKNKQTGYGLTDELIEQLQIGFARGDGLLSYLKGKGATEEECLSTGLFFRFDNGNIVEAFNKRLVFPYWAHGHVVYMIARKTRHTPEKDFEQPKYKKLLTHSEKAPWVSKHIENRYFYNESVGAKAKEVLITEGVTDCISAMQAGVPCISPVTTRFRDEDIPKLLELTKHCLSITICNDAEANGAGERGARVTAAALWRCGRRVRIATLPRPAGRDKIDINELVREQGEEALRNVLADAKPWPIYLLEKVPADLAVDQVMGALRPVFDSLVKADAAITTAISAQVTKRFGIGKRDFNNQINDARFRAREAERAQAEAKLAAEAVEHVEHRGQYDLSNDKTKSDQIEDVRELFVVQNEKRIESFSLTPSNLGRKGRSNRSPVFGAGSAMVYLARTKERSVELKEVGEDQVHTFLNTEVLWWRQNKDRVVSSWPDREFAKSILSDPPELPQVDSVIRTPVYGADGKLIDKSGLHEKERAWVDIKGLQDVMAQVPANPTPEQLKAAKDLFFDEVLHDFHFQSDADAATWFALLFCPFVRRMIDGPTPLHVVEAPVAGTGKTKLCTIVGIVTTGEEPPLKKLSDDEAEVEKVITSQLLKSSPIVIYDNASEKMTISSESLAIVLTARFWEGRRLGQSQMLQLPITQTWCLTGNNPRLSRDIARRVVRIRIIAKCDQPSARRDFKHQDLMGWVSSHRSDLLVAVFTMINGWIAAGRPNGKAMLGSYERWAAVMSGILETNGLPGLCENLQEMYEDADQDTSQWREFVKLWGEAHKDATLTAPKLQELAEEREMLANVIGDGTPRAQSLRFGRALSAQRGRVYGGWEVTKCKADRGRYVGWKLTWVGDASAAPTAAAQPQLPMAALPPPAVEPPTSDEVFGGDDDDDDDDDIFR